MFECFLGLEYGKMFVFPALIPCLIGINIQSAFLLQAENSANLSLEMCRKPGEERCVWDGAGVTYVSLQNLAAPCWFQTVTPSRFCVFVHSGFTHPVPGAGA
ncbi:hypothetical protein AMECASPLE_027226 [Ameca splendens]|uniref:Uncharacterized protein n=1 Tax=Ameca splendens TaxID=208324 RepID=A0ABV0XU20_9TELE